MKKIGRIIISFFLTTFLLSAAAVPVHATASAEILIGSVVNIVSSQIYYQYDAAQNTLSDVGAAGAWNAYYDAGTGVLTLRNLTVSTSTILMRIQTQGAPTLECIGIYVNSQTPITINLEGTNTVTLDNPQPEQQIPETVSGILLTGQTQHTISGSGTLNISATGSLDEAAGMNSIAFGINVAVGTLSIESGTINASAKGVINGLGIGAEGLDAAQNISLYVKGGNITAEGIAIGRTGTTMGSATGIASFGASYISGGTIHATGMGSFLSIGFNTAAGVQFSGGEAFINSVPVPDSDATLVGFHIQPGFTPAFSPVLSLLNGEAILEADTRTGSSVTDTGIHTFTFNNVDFGSIGPDGGTMNDLAAYVHIGPTSSPTPSGGSSWTPSYEIKFKDCSGNVISDQWVAEGQPAAIPAGYTYGEEELNWVYRNLTVSPTSCQATGYVVPNTADKN